MIIVGGEEVGKIPKRMEEIVGAGQLAVMLSWSSLDWVVYPLDPGKGSWGKKNSPMLDRSYVGISPYTESAAGLNQLLLPNFAQAICVACPFRPFVSSYTSEIGERRGRGTYRWKDKRPGRCYLARVPSALVALARKTWLRRPGALSEALSVDSVTLSSAQRRWCIACEAINNWRIFPGWHGEPYQTAARAMGTEITASQFIVGVE